MRKLFTLLALLLCLTGLKAQFVTIPDANFVTWLQTNVPSAMNGNHMDTTSLAVTQFNHINISSLGIQNLNGIQYFDSLRILECGTDACGHNPTPIIFFPKLPDNLKTLGSRGAFLASLPILPNNLEQIDISNNFLTSLTNLPKTLKYLDCSNNYINSLNNLPNSLTGLTCSSLVLDTLCNLPSQLAYLDCNGSQVTHICSLPNSLTFLRVCYNLLSALPNIPNRLKEFDCSFNQLTSLPNLSDSLVYFDCRNNQLTALPSLPSSLEVLVCNDNNIKCFAPFNTSTLFAIIISNNPFDCLPNYSTAMDAELFLYPICQLGNVNGCYSSITTSIDEVLHGNSMSLYPNPTAGIFTIKLHEKEKQLVELFDITGNTVLSQTIENGQGNIDASHLAAGVYTINIKANSTVINKKVVIVK